MRASIDALCRRLDIDDGRCVEIESKRRVQPGDVEKIRRWLLARKRVRHDRAAFFFDQYLDTPAMDLFRLGASLRLRYKKDGLNVYLQYKGPGFRKDGLLFRSEFSTERLRDVPREESRHDTVHFSHTSVRRILERHAPPAMARAMQAHLGSRTIARITASPLLCAYQKEKFLAPLGTVFLEPSLDRVFAFHIGGGGILPLSTFCEYENEIKALGESLEAKVRKIDVLLEFDAALGRRFDAPPEPHDKYHRCASFLVPRRR
jgi:hypothetical protein